MTLVVINNDDNMNNNSNAFSSNRSFKARAGIDVINDYAMSYLFNKMLSYRRETALQGAL